MKRSNKCNICSERLLNYRTYLKCSMHHHSSHPKCNFLSKTNADELMLNSDWMCKTCTKDIFPLINDAISHLNVKIDTYSQNNCHSCSKAMGKKIVKCDMCNNNIHRCCKLDNFGCKNADMTDFHNHVIYFPMEEIQIFSTLMIAIIYVTKFVMMKNSKVRLKYGIHYPKTCENVNTLSYIHSNFFQRK